MIVLVLPEMRDDEALLARARRGDKVAIGEIYHHYVESIYQFTRLRVGDAQAAEDITSTVFEKFIDALAKGKGPNTHLRGWLFQVARNAIYDSYGKVQALPIETIEQMALEDDTPEISVLQSLDHEMIRGLIQTLSPDQQEVLLLRFDQQLSLQETADIMGQNVNTVKTLQFRAVAKLRKLLSHDRIRD